MQCVEPEDYKAEVYPADIKPCSVEIALLTTTPGRWVGRSRCHPGGKERVVQGYYR